VTRRRLAALASLTAALAACGGGTSGAGPTPPPRPACDGARARAEQLYGAAAAASATPPPATEVADNVAMVAADCEADPARVAPCAEAAASVSALEACLRPIDDDGSEGLELRGE
jgi:hypothetical protein